MFQEHLMYENKPQDNCIFWCSVLSCRQDIILSQDMKGYFSDIDLNQRVRSICHMSLGFPINRIYDIINHIFMLFYQL